MPGNISQTSLTTGKKSSVEETKVIFLDRTVPPWRCQRCCLCVCVTCVLLVYNCCGGMDTCVATLVSSGCVTSDQCTAHDNVMMEQAASCNTLDDLRKVFETNFWNDVSEDEGIGSDDSMENGTSSSGDNDSEKELYNTVKLAGDRTKKQDFRNRIKRSKSLVAINQLSSRIFHQISRKFSDDRSVVSSHRESCSPASSGSRLPTLHPVKIDVFGCELSDLCIKTDCEVPEIVTFCVEKIEQIGITDGIYRISGTNKIGVILMRQLS